MNLQFLAVIQCNNSDGTIQNQTKTYMFRVFFFNYCEHGIPVIQAITGIFYNMERKLWTWNSLQLYNE